MLRRKGFTLVELVVVILILGILAGVAAPKMFSTSVQATENGLRQTLSTVRDAIELHQAKTGSYPPCTSTGDDFKNALRPFLRGPFPASPYGTQDNAITPAGGTPLVATGATAGWMYNPATGEFICNSNDTNSDGIAYSAL